MLKLVENYELIPESSWQKHIDELRKATASSTKEELKKTIVDSIKKLVPRKKFGIFFSGGVDSTLITFICKILNADFVCYSVGLKNSPDVNWAKRAAEKLKLKLKVKEFEMNKLKEIFKKTARIFRKPDVLSVGVASVVVAAAELAKNDEVDTFFSGLGSEEIFAGYQRHLEAEDRHEECWRGLRDVVWRRDLVRDSSVAKALKIKLLVPFLDGNVIKSAMGIHVSKKINEKYKKIILREIAEELGLPKEFAWREKKAAQYGSGFDKAMEKIARMKGFRTKKEYVESF